MKFQKLWNASLLRHCSQCSRWTGNIDLYCETCWAEIFSDKTPLGVGLLYRLPFPIFSMLRWTDERPEVGQLVHSLKGDWAKAAWENVAQRFAFQYLSEQRPLQMESLFVPAPPAVIGIPDHARIFAEALSSVFNRPVYTGLTRVSVGPQKTKVKRDRWKTEVKPPDEYLPEAKCYIFVDDLITTGATAKAVWKSLNSPMNFQVWSLACRPLRGL